MPSEKIGLDESHNIQNDAQYLLVFKLDCDKEQHNNDDIDEENGLCKSVYKDIFDAINETAMISGNLDALDGVSNDEKKQAEIHDESN